MCENVISPTTRFSQPGDTTRQQLRQLTDLDAEGLGEAGAVDILEAERPLRHRLRHLKEIIVHFLGQKRLA